MPLHLLFPLFSSVIFVIAMMFAKQAISRGASPWTSTFLSNLWLGISWSLIGLFQSDWLPASAWWQAALVGLSFMTGQLFTYLAFQHGDVSVATPVLGVKVIIVASLLSLIVGESIGLRVWMGAILAAIGVGVIQAGARSTNSSSTRSGERHTLRRTALTIVLSLLSATSLSLFDIGLQTWGREWGGQRFLPAMFVSIGILSCTILPWVDTPKQLTRLRVVRPMLLGTSLMALQAISMSLALGVFGDATRINIVYALRGLWAVGLTWFLARSFGGAEANHSTRTMLLRLTGALLLTASVVVALSHHE